MPARCTDPNCQRLGERLADHQHIPYAPPPGVTMTDTDAERRALIPEMPAELLARVAAGEQVWTTDQMREDFETVGFAAPFIVVRRRSDDVLGSLMFTHSPRYYFGFQED